MSESIQCWQCGTRMTLDELASNDGDCPRCEVEVHLAEYLDNALSKVATLEAELATVKKVAYGNMELLDENRNLQAELAKLRAGQEPVAFYWQDVGYKNPNRHGPYFGWPAEAALRNVDGGAIPVPLYATPQPSAVPDGWRPVPITSLERMIRLIDPEPVRMPNGDTMVFKNPHAAAALREISAEFRAMLAAAPSAPKADDPVKVQLLEALTDSLELMETLCAFEGDTIRKARAAIAAARQEGGK